MESKFFYREKKVMKMAIVKELTGLSERQIRYYEERKLIFPERTSSGNRKYSFSDIELLAEISKKIQSGLQIEAIREEFEKQSSQLKVDTSTIIKNQLQAYFRRTCF